MEGSALLQEGSPLLMLRETTYLLPVLTEITYLLPVRTEITYLLQGSVNLSTT